jgi:hypothetical protein
VVWAKYKIEETADVDKPQSWVLGLLAHSRLYRVLGDIRQWRIRASTIAAAAAPAEPAIPPSPQAMKPSQCRRRGVIGLRWMAAGRFA